MLNLCKLYTLQKHNNVIEIIFININYLKKFMDGDNRSEHTHSELKARFCGTYGERYFGIRVLSR